MAEEISNQIEKDVLLEQLIVASSNGDIRTVEDLLKNNEQLNINSVNDIGKTALHCTSEAGFADVVELLCRSGADCNIQDQRGRTALHWACHLKHAHVAILLLQLGCELNIADEIGETALHIASRVNLLSVVQMLCACCCDVDAKTKDGLTALHLAAKEGHIETVRSLMLGGIDMDLCTPGGVTAEDLATAHGHRELADLLSNLTSSITRDQRETVARQLLPTTKFLTRIRVNILGNSGVGKTTLIESLKCGFIRSLFRRSGATVLSSTAGQTSSDGTQLADMTPTIRGNNYKQPTNAQFTRGIVVQQANISVAGDVSLWEFSGYESYYTVYDRFLGDPNSIYLVVVDMRNSFNERMKQLGFWFNFIRSRTVPVEPIGFGGVRLWAPRVIIIATHSDIAGSESEKTQGLLEQIIQTYTADLVIEKHLFILDSNQAMGSEMKLLRQTISDIKKFICEGLPPSIGILDMTIAALPEWRRVLSSFPVVTWHSFMDYIRIKVNLLATEIHLRELVNQLQIMGEVHCLLREDQELVVINPQWLCSDVIGQLFSYDCLMSGPTDGQFAIDQLRQMIPKAEPSDAVLMLDSLELCVINQRNGNNLYNILIFDKSHAPSELKFAHKDVLGGFRIQPEYSDQLVHVFARIIHSLVCRLRQPSSTDSPGTTVEHWSTGIKASRGKINAIVHLSVESNHITTVIGGPSDQRKQMFFFQEDICEAIYASLETCCPALYLERAPLSVTSLRAASLPTDHVPSYRPRDVVMAQLTGADSIHLDNNNTTSEKLIDLVAFGDTHIFSCLQTGVDQFLGTLPLYARYRLATLLDSSKTGVDWISLANALGIEVDPAVKDKGSPVFSQTDGVLGEWVRVSSGGVTIRDLYEKLKVLDRGDVVEELVSLSPLYRFVNTDDGSGALKALK